MNKNNKKKYRKTAPLNDEDQKRLDNLVKTFEVYVTAWYMMPSSGWDKKTIDNFREDVYAVFTKAMKDGGQFMHAKLKQTKMEIFQKIEEQKQFANIKREEFKKLN